MFLKVDPASSVPVYAQIVQQVKHGVAAGLLRSGDFLPSLRDAARLLRINPNTVVKAYRELEAQGVVCTEHGRGTMITGRGIEAGSDDRSDELYRQAEQLVVEGYHLGAGPNEISDAVRAALRNLKPQFDARDAAREKTDE